jgi:sodium-dependent dicarboxylate transporter 2/3/5
MKVFVPLGAAFLVLAWLVLAGRLQTPAGAPSLDRGFFREKLHALGPPSAAEKTMFAIFCMTAALWIFRKPLQLGPGIAVPGWGEAMTVALQRLGALGKLAEFVDDSTVAIAMSLLMFFIPARRDESGRTEYLMDWRTVERLPWGILLLIGGGFAIANAFRDAGLSLWLGKWFAAAAGGLPLWLLIVAVCVLLTILTEFTTNVATVSATLPILAGAAVGMSVDPRLVMLPATLAASCGFMLPIATPPNALAFASGKVRMATMARYGLILNLLGVLLVTAAMFLLAIPQLGISPSGLPDWAATAR